MWPFSCSTPAKEGLLPGAKLSLLPEGEYFFTCTGVKFNSTHRGRGFIQLCLNPQGFQPTNVFYSIFTESQLLDVCELFSFRPNLNVPLLDVAEALIGQTTKTRGRLYHQQNWAGRSWMGARFSIDRSDF